MRPTVTLYYLVPVTMKDILWEPEEGVCSSCKCEGDQVRGFSSEGAYQIVCFGCWNANQCGCMISSMDWADDTAYVFGLSRPSEPPNSGTAQRASLN